MFSGERPENIKKNKLCALCVFAVNIYFFNDVQAGLMTIVAALSLSRYVAASRDNSRLVMAA